ncbi:MAG: hypothetical protein F6J92_06480 [Symploca sp. SIO1A3]|nr:hypothetical protein [Symploca sp. SIO1A3]
MPLELIGTVDIPHPIELNEFTLNAKELKKLRRAKIINLEAYVYLEGKIQYGKKSHMRIHSESFCEDWGLLPHKVGAEECQTSEERTGWLYKPRVHPA